MKAQKKRTREESELQSSKRPFEYKFPHGQTMPPHAIDEHFFAICILSGMRSKDPCTQVGACVVDNDNNLLGTGYNGMPRGCHDDIYPWGKHTYDPMQNKHTYVCHAEVNAILNSSKNVQNCRIYVTLFPCNECTKIIIQAGIREIIYLSDKHAKKNSNKAAKRMVNSAGVRSRHFQSQKTFVISLSNNNA